MMRVAVFAAMVALLAGCATPESRVRSALMNVGLSRPMATCMADRMADRLSLAQLNRLGDLGEFEGRDPGDISINQFVDMTRALRDPEIIGVTTSSGAICAIRS
ncbi:hypothetical protein [Alterisphingorhabdus coralli]|uniref:Lipoprotein n=1 Tax=Alterisphingorhabdus coralli TaxID=3071408 RepID=A0AA97FAX7_9SPHN|nr:hypothetical protein [Parasphingorhabdus sp. SCSIO 66989]WOE75730.1 hypothetical protein RB602_03180 [Parasphingorhabdus sp. SCSIO 66989]